MTTRLGIVGIRDAVYYAPQIVADRLGYLADENLTIDFVGGVPGYGLAEEVARGRADVVLGGIWRPMLYVSRGNRFVAFAQLNGHCDFQVLARKPLADDVRLDGMRVLLTTTLAPSPWFALREWFVRCDVDIGSLRLVPALPIGEAQRLFTEGGADLIEIEDTDAAPLLAAGAVPVATWPEDIGGLPWGVYYTTPEWLAEHAAEARALTTALARAQTWIAGHAPHEIAEVVAYNFPQEPVRHVELLVELYAQRQRMWSTNTAVDPGAYERWNRILVRSGWLDAPVPYEQVVDTTIVPTVAA